VSWFGCAGGERCARPLRIPEQFRFGTARSLQSNANGRKFIAYSPLMGVSVAVVTCAS
jgi:hypothetical protein